MKIATIIAMLLLLPSFSFAWDDNHIRFAPKKPVNIVKPAALVEGTFQQNIDHFGKAGDQTFAQRYWVDTEYASSATNAPVIYHICGEGDAEQGYFLNDNAIPWAKTLGANLVYLEHRYYGQSLPFSDLSTDHLQYLTVDNVMEDLATFQRWMTQNQGWTGQWVSVGGSYSGTLSALYRQKHPELVAGALASSAPMISGIGTPLNTDPDIASLESTDPSSDTGERQWAYQACTFLGFWEAEGATPGSVIYLPGQSLCSQVFGDVPYFNSTTYNQDYDLPFISNTSGAPSNILFTYGSDDIWTTLGLSTQTNSNTTISILMIDGAGHHFDLNAPDPSDSAAVVAARNEFVTQAKTWLTSGCAGPACH